jgi:hypothetical protein
MFSSRTNNILKKCIHCIRFQNEWTEPIDPPWYWDLHGHNIAWLRAVGLQKDQVLTAHCGRDINMYDWPPLECHCHRYSTWWQWHVEIQQIAARWEASPDAAWQADKKADRQLFSCNLTEFELAIMSCKCTFYAQYGILRSIAGKMNPWTWIQSGRGAIHSCLWSPQTNNILFEPAWWAKH